MQGSKFLTVVPVVCALALGLATLASGRAAGPRVELVGPFAESWGLHHAAFSSAYGWASTLDYDSAGNARSLDDRFNVIFGSPAAPISAGADFGTHPLGCGSTAPGNPAYDAARCASMSLPSWIVRSYGGAIHITVEGTPWAFTTGSGGGGTGIAACGGQECDYQEITILRGPEQPAEATATAVVTDAGTGAELARIALHVKWVPAVPAPQTPPEITGDPEVGSKLTASHGDWAPEVPVPDYSYVWERCATGCTPIVGATNATYMPTAADVGKRLRVVVTATTDGGSWDAASDQTPVVTPHRAVAPRPTVRPSIAGVPRVGGTLRVRTGTWAGDAPLTFHVQWSVCRASCKAVSTAPALKVIATYAGARIRAIVTAKNAVGSASVSVTTSTVKR